MNKTFTNTESISFFDKLQVDEGNEHLGLGGERACSDMTYALVFVQKLHS